MALDRAFLGAHVFKERGYNEPYRQHWQCSASVHTVTLFITAAVLLYSVLNLLLILTHQI
jgi:hypothetical protein